MAQILFSDWDSVFWIALMFWNVFFEGAIYLEYMVAD